MEKEKEYFSPFILDDGTFEDYLEDMKDQHEWGGNLELQALSMALNLTIVVHMIDRKPMIIWRNHGARVIQLAFHMEDELAEHYSSVRYIGDEGNGPALEDLRWKQQAQQEDDTQLDDYYFNKDDYQQIEENKYQQIEESKYQYIEEIKQNEFEEYDDDDDDDDIEKIEQQFKQLENENAAKKKEQEYAIKQLEEKFKQQMLLETQPQLLNQIAKEVNKEQKEKIIPENYSKNKRCYCGSKLKYKNCCYKKDQAEKEKKEQIEIIPTNGKAFYTIFV